MQVTITRTTGGHPTFPTNQLTVHVLAHGNAVEELDRLQEALDRFLHEYLDLPDDSSNPLSQSPVTGA